MTSIPLIHCNQLHLQQYFRLHCSIIQQHEQWLGITEIRNWRFKCQFIMKASIRYMICVNVPANVKTKSHRIWNFPIVFRFHWNYMVRHRMAWNENKTFSGEFAFQLKAWYGWRLRCTMKIENWPECTLCTGASLRSWSSLHSQFILMFISR